MEQNRDWYKERKQKESQIQMKIKEAQKVIQKIEGYKGSGNSMIYHLEMAKQIINQNIDTAIIGLDSQEQKNQETVNNIEQKIKEIVEVREQK